MLNGARLETASWLAHVPDDAPLHSLILPGTHDSLSAEPVLPSKFMSILFSGIITRMAQTQTLSLREQLESGVRFLDLRYKCVKGELVAFHGVTCLNTTYPESLREICSFLKERPSEFVLVRVKSEEHPQHGRFGEMVSGCVGSPQVSPFVYVEGKVEEDQPANHDIDSDALESKSEALSSLDLGDASAAKGKRGANTPVGHVRGKLVLLRDGFDGLAGICYRSESVVQDMYRFQSADLKFDLFRKFLDMARDRPTNTPRSTKLHVNFLTAAGTFNQMLFHRNTPKIISDTLQEKFMRVFLSEQEGDTSAERAEEKRELAGVIVLDFATHNLCSEIVSRAVAAFQPLANRE